MPSDFDPFGWDDDIEFNPDELDTGELGDDIDDLQDLWNLAMDYDYEDLMAYEFHGTGDTG